MRSSGQWQTVLAGAVIALAVILSVLAAVVLAAWDRLATGPQPRPAPSLTATAAVIAVASPTSRAPTATPTPTPSPSAMPGPSVTRTPGPTSSPTATASVTPTPTATPARTPRACGPPANWVQVRLLPGETLYRLAVRYGTTIARLQQANCMGSSTILLDYQLFWVPPVMVISPTPTPDR